ncbi:MAG TPA: oligopeptide/dipeptide ABC transporter ATP-binding protein [Vicinamibacteria bacterium]|nr:oligopeptide/dipeptide ABC transporter ATP-binding protein [Vicinamibacteria bacterium]
MSSAPGQDGVGEALLEVRDLRTFFYRRGRFGVVRPDDYVAAVDGVSFGVQEGESLGIVGESGCGKTTLGRTVLRVIPATSGSVRYRGEEILGLGGAALRAKRRDMQMIFQDLDAALNPKMRVGDLLAEALTLHKKLSPPEVRRRSEELLGMVKLKPAKLSAFPPELSGGEKRRVSIARVLAVEPRLIVADEPLSALDVSIAAQVANLMRDLQESLKLTYLFISHDLRMVELIAHRVMVMYLGRVVEMAPARYLAAGAAHPYSRLLWAAVDPYTGLRMEPATASGRWEISEGDRPKAGCRFRDRCPIFHAKGEPAICSDAQTEPQLTQVSPGHLVACHFPQGRGEATGLA